MTQQKNTKKKTENMKNEREMQNEGLFSVINAINRNKNRGLNTFKLKCLMNKEKAEERIEKLKEACGVDRPSDDMKQYQEELQNLQREYAEKDESGQIKLYDAQTDKEISPQNAEGKKIVTKIAKESQNKYLPCAQPPKKKLH